MNDVAARLGRKVGPLPVWGWAVFLLVAYFLYQHFRGSASSAVTSTSGQAGTSDASPVPGFDAANDLGSGGSGFGTPPPQTITNNYYGVPPSGGGTATSPIGQKTPTGGGLQGQPEGPVASGPFASGSPVASGGTIPIPHQPER